jgi:hypothetical protein
MTNIFREKKIDGHTYTLYTHASPKSLVNKLVKQLKKNKAISPKSVRVFKVSDYWGIYYR